MKKLVLVIAVCALAMTRVFAGTPDGVTPANEGICDDLQGGTPSLYGLCVAFCEAQDVFSENIPVTDAEIDLIISENQSAERILNKYDERRQAGDPTMPCIVKAQEEACPCFQTSELEMYINESGFYSSSPQATIVRNLDGNSAQFISLTSNKRTTCRALFLDVNNNFIRRQVNTTPEEQASCIKIQDDFAAANGL